MKAVELDGAAARAASPEKAVAKKSGARKAYMILAAVAALTLIGYFGYGFVMGGKESTDDAQVEADVVPMAARVGGLVVKVAVQDNQSVRKGDLIVELDPTDYEIRVRQAEADFEAAQAQARESTSKGGAVAAAQVAAAKANLVRTEAEQRKAETDLARAKKLRSENAISPVELENSQNAYDKAVAATAQATAQLHLAEEQHTTAEAKVKAAQAALDYAKAQLSYTKVVAPSDGVLSKMVVHAGQLVQPNQLLAQLVSNDVYMVANFKETQVGRMQAGQKAKIEVDGYPGKDFEGEVESISPATGARFSLLPPDNASGNFVKVVQRVPVKIKLAPVKNEAPLRAGLSADVTVNVN